MQHARLRMAEVEALVGARDRDVHQAAFFFEPVAVAHGVLVREQAFFHAGDRHTVELQAAVADRKLTRRHKVTFGLSASFGAALTNSYNPGTGVNPSILMQ